MMWLQWPAVQSRGIFDALHIPLCHINMMKGDISLRLRISRKLKKLFFGLPQPLWGPEALLALVQRCGTSLEDSSLCSMVHLTLSSPSVPKLTHCIGLCVGFAFDTNISLRHTDEPRRKSFAYRCNESLLATHANCSSLIFIVIIHLNLDYRHVEALALLLTNFTS